MITIDIVGGGVAGLALAGALDPARFHVRLHEQDAEAARLGTVFGMWPDAMAALARLGLADRVRAASVPAEGATVFTRTGRRLAHTNGPATGRLIPRPTLLDILAAAVPPEVERVHRRVGDPAGLDGDVVVAADGARSAVRQAVWGTASRPTGTMALRGVVTGAVGAYSPGQRGLHEFWGRGLLFGTSPSVGATNWYAAARERTVTPAEGLDWARAAYAGFPPAVRAVLAAADPAHTLVNRVVEAPTLGSLVRGRHVLVGDAAHAMSPNLGRGACESLVDAAVLAEELSTRPPREALRRYNRRRLVPGQAVRVASAAVRRMALGGH